MCPSGVVNRDYSDTSRVMNTVVNENVVVLDNNDVTIYKCPITGSDNLAGHRLFVTSQRVDLSAGQIMSSEQAEGILHTVGLVSHLGNV